MGEMLRQALFSITGWWVSLIFFGAWLWLLLRRDYRLFDKELQHEAAVNFASGLADPEQGLHFLRLMTSRQFDLVCKRFPDWPTFLDTFYDEVDR